MIPVDKPATYTDVRSS